MTDRIAAFSKVLREWWSFSDTQQHTHSWHTREDFIERELPRLLPVEEDVFDELKPLGIVPSDRVCTGSKELSLVPTIGVIMREGPRRSRLVVRENDCLVDWALLEWTASNIDGSDPSYGIIAHGSGVSGALREARHTFFGDNGYVHCLDSEVLFWGIKQLKEWFDFPSNAAHP